MTKTLRQATYLTEILEKRRERIEKDVAGFPIENLRREAFAARKIAEPNRLQKALERSERTNIIAEFKRFSPSKGAINVSAKPKEIARIYFDNGAAAISVLTEPDFFSGSFADLTAAVGAIDDKIPVLCKDFIFNERQIFQAATAGASAILLIVAAFTEIEIEKLKELFLLAEEIGLDALVEVHTLEEMRVAEQIGAKIIGVNNRNLQTFQVSLETSVELIKSAPNDTILISESGLRTREDILRLRALGFKGFLIGETLMKSEDVGAKLKEFAAKIV
ncbi:MAG: indole-3-glycerol phosphate synthase TrpC [Acidobacteria bacterium]|jgi:indole-3-glycerol phosphate synthase|nr:indole-3-glycerol phosphate synthase TrpC [Acidobacteriota bacterium]